MSLCECGCGSVTRVATKTRGELGWVKGQHHRFIRGHNRRGERKPIVHQQFSKQELCRALSGSRRSLASRELVYVGRDNPMSDSRGYCYVYRLLAAGLVGRWLEHDEEVHHIDLDPTNNSLGNLVVLTRSQHRYVHWQIRKGSAPRAALASVMEEVPVGR